MNSFAGTWIDENDTEISVEQTENIATVAFSNGRGPFAGFEVDLYAPVLSVNFSDDAPFTGVLAGSSIQWSNGTAWNRS